MDSIMDLANKRPVLFDGAMGTEIQARPSPNYGPHKGLNEVLVRTDPSVIEEIHAAYLEAGADVIETDTFGANPLVLSEYGLASEVEVLNQEAANLSRRVADHYSTAGHRRFVSGSVGPGTKLPSLGQVPFEDLVGGYRLQCVGLLRGGVDLIQIETSQDPLQARAAVVGAWKAMEETGREVPLFCQVTFDKDGRMLLGTEPLAAMTTLARMRHVSVFGVNCSVGPEHLRQVVKELADHCPKPLAVLPNAGLPEIRDGETIYPLDPQRFARHMTVFVREMGVAFVGGCCGTTPEHIRALRAALRGVTTCSRSIHFVPALSSLYSAVPIHQEPRPLVVGERTNATGSKRFRTTLQANDYAGMVEVASQQVAEGAHVLDVSLALTGRDEALDAERFLSLLRQEVDAPVMLDTTNPVVVQRFFEVFPGRPILNSVNLEDGGERLRQVAAVARDFGAALVLLCIDEKGMCMTADAKVDCARRMADILVNEFGFDTTDFLVDPLTFTLVSGDDSLRRSAVETLRAIERVKKEIPGASTSLGISNVSYGLPPGLRKVLNSVFLYQALQAGLDAAILNAGKVLPWEAIPEYLRQLAENLLFDRWVDGKDPLEAFLHASQGPSIRDVDVHAASAGAEDPRRALRTNLLRGEKGGIEGLVEKLLAHGLEPMDIVNDVLLPAMKEVGDLFAAGKMHLPFVLKSAEVFKAVVSLLEPRMPKTAANRGTIVLATVAGDVHDIGKNLVDILLSNNGFRVVNLGIKQPLSAMLDAVKRERALALGMSGLLVRSVQVMHENIREMERLGLSIPVLVGGAALTRSYVENSMAPDYSGLVVYCRDAFQGLRVAEALERGELTSLRQTRGRKKEAVGKTGNSQPHSKARKPPVRIEVRPAPDFPRPPFLGTRELARIAVDTVVPYLNRKALFVARWGFRPGGDKEEWQREQQRLERLLHEKLSQYRDAFEPRGIMGFFRAGSQGDAVVLLDPRGDQEIARFTFPRGKLCLSDFVANLDGPHRDHVGVQLVTVGPRVAVLEQELKEGGRYQDYLLVHGIAVELAEAAAEYVHALIRKEWGIADHDAPTMEGVLHKGYRGCRYSFGYPACPDLEQQRTLLRLLGAERIGVALTETCQMVPEASTSAIVLHHPDADYFVP